MTRDISNSDNTIDSRDVIKRFDELIADRDALQEEIDELETKLTWESDETNTKLDEAKEALANWLADYGDELKALQDLIEECENDVEDWSHGATLIHDDYFADYARDYLEEMGCIPRNLSDLIVIDWEASANNLQAEYTSFNFDGETYWAR